MSPSISLWQTFLRDSKKKKKYSLPLWGRGMRVTGEVALKWGFKNEAGRRARAWGSQMVSVTMKQTSSLGCLYNLSQLPMGRNGRAQFWRAEGKLTVSLQQNIQAVLKRKWQVYLPSVPKEKALKPHTHTYTHKHTNKHTQTHTHTHPVTILYKQLYVHGCTRAWNLFPAHTGDVARCNDLIGLPHLSRACVNCHEKLDGFTLYSPLILSEPIPQTNGFDGLLSRNPVMPCGALKSSAQPCLEFSSLLVNDSRNKMNLSQEERSWETR